MAWLKDLVKSGAKHVAHDSGDIEIEYSENATIIRNRESRYPGDGRNWDATIASDGSVAKASDDGDTRVVVVIEPERARGWMERAADALRGYNTDRWHEVE